MQRYITIAGLVALISASAHATCTIQYACGTGATGTAPTGTSVASGTTFKTAANTCAKDGYVFSHYLATVSNYVTAQDGVAQQDATYTIPFNGSNTCSSTLTITLTPQWVPASGTPVASAKTYTDSELATRQPNFTGSATDKLILFSSSTDGAFGERAVVSSLGTPNSTSGLYSGTDLSSTEVPTNSAVNTGVNRKQATVNGTANYVAMYDENAHMTGDAKGIYNASSLTDLDTLVEAETLNDAIIAAVNSELKQVDESGHESNSGTLWKLNTAANLSLLGPASGGGSGSALDLSLLTSNNYNTVCFKSGLPDYWNEENSCSAEVYGSLGAGDWAVEYNVDEEPVYLVGATVCSEEAPQAANAVATSAEKQILDADYQNQSWFFDEDNPDNNKDSYCWCRLGGANASNWVNINNYAGHNPCGDCPYDCLERVTGFGASGVFGEASL